MQMFGNFEGTHFVPPPKKNNMSASLFGEVVNSFLLTTCFFLFFGEAFGGDSFWFKYWSRSPEL